MGGRPSRSEPRRAARMAGGTWRRGIAERGPPARTASAAAARGKPRRTRGGGPARDALPAGLRPARGQRNTVPGPRLRAPHRVAAFDRRDGSAQRIRAFFRRARVQRKSGCSEVPRNARIPARAVRPRPGAPLAVARARRSRCQTPAQGPAACAWLRARDRPSGARAARTALGEADGNLHPGRPG